MRLGDTGVYADRRANQIGGALAVSGLQGDDPQQVQRVKMPGIGLQNLPIQRLGLRQLPLLMQGDGLLGFKRQRRILRVCRHGRDGRGCFKKG